MRHVAAARARRGLTCPLHGAAFVRFSAPNRCGYEDSSHGCPACVAAIRADVRRERSRAPFSAAPWQRTWDYVARREAGFTSPPAGGKLDGLEAHHAR